MAVFQSLGTPTPQPQPVQNTEPSRAKKILRYTMMPEILPRIRGLGVHFGHFAYLLALVFASARLIPQAHPVMNAAHIGRFGVRQVIAIAANNLTWSMKNIDQIAIFSAIMMGMMMIIIQAGLIAAAALMGGEAQAQSQDVASFFVVPNAAEDISLSYLAHVFGDLDGFWGDGIAPPATNTQIHLGLYAILSMYSTAMMVIAVIVVLYYILTVIGEAAKTGTPFGQRFNSLWAPIRLIVALGLLVPLASGLNSAQYITLWTAKMGAGLGGTVWAEFSQYLNDTSGREYTIPETKPIWAIDFAENVFLAEVCSAAYNQMPDGYNFSGVVSQAGEFSVVWKAANPGSLPNWRTSCGRASLSIPKFEDQDIMATDLIKAEVANFTNAIIGLAKTPAEQLAASKFPGGSAAELDSLMTTLYTGAQQEAAAFKSALEGIYKDNVSRITEKTLEDAAEKGWMFAAVFYMNISKIIQQSEQMKQINLPNITLPQGQFKSVTGPKTVGEYITLVGNNISGAYVHTDSAIDDAEEYIANIEAKEAFTTRVELAKEYARLYLNYGNVFGWAYNAYDWMATDENDPACAGDAQTGMGKVKCAVYTMIVPEELVLLAFDSKKNMDPMSTLMIAGANIITKAWMFVAAGLVTEGVLGSLPYVGSALATLGSMLVLIGVIGIGAGFVLFYLLPLMPFIYFFFAAVSWIMEIFEAVVAMPLWALAHLRIDGDGMPGQAAMNGYYLLLAILLRPMLIIFGLIGGVIIFGASIYILQQMFAPMVAAANNDSSSGFDMLVYSVMYAFLCYTIGTISFKLVDLVPKQILRWIGSGAQSFSDDKGDPIGGNQQMLMATGGILGGQVANTLSQGAKGTGQGIASAKKEKDNEALALKGEEKRDTQHSELMGAASGGRDKKDDKPDDKK